MVYSSYIDGGCVPIALALEEIGITRYGDRSKSLFETPPKESIGRYVMITGDKGFSPNPEMDIKMDVPIVLQSMSSQDTYEGDYETRRALIWNLNFVMKAYMEI